MPCLVNIWEACSFRKGNGRGMELEEREGMCMGGTSMGGGRANFG